MKYVLAIIVLMVGYKYVAQNPDSLAVLSQYKEWFIALALGIASKPLLKRIFE